MPMSVPSAIKGLHITPVVGSWATAAGQDVFAQFVAPSAGFVETTEANSNKAITGYSWTIREVHLRVHVGTGNLTAAIRDDLADAWTCAGAITGTGDLDETGLGIVVAAGSLVCMRWNNSTSVGTK